MMHLRLSDRSRSTPLPKLVFTDTVLSIAVWSLGANHVTQITYRPTALAAKQKT